MPFKLLSSEYISRHQYFTARKDSYQTPDEKIVDPYYVVELPPCVVAMALTENSEVVMVEQYRHPIQQKVLELPGGFIDEKEEPHHALGKTCANPGVLNNFTYFFLATGGKKIAKQSLDPNEEIEIILKPLEEVKQLLMDNKIVQSLHALCLFYGFNFLEKNTNLPSPQ
jgi:ADP-ribose pyrophosphatase